MEISKILEIKDNEIANRHKEIDNILQENDDLKKKLKVKIIPMVKLYLYIF